MNAIEAGSAHIEIPQPQVDLQPDFLDDSGVNQGFVPKETLFENLQKPNRLTGLKLALGGAVAGIATIACGSGEEGKTTILGETPISVAQTLEPGKTEVVVKLSPTPEPTKTPEPIPTPIGPTESQKAETRASAGQIMLNVIESFSDISR